jgi:hypothetical protein
MNTENPFLLHQVFVTFSIFSYNIFFFGQFLMSAVNIFNISGKGLLVIQISLSNKNIFINYVVQLNFT